MKDDLISRQAAIDAIDDYLDEYSGLDEEGYHSEKWCAMAEAKMVIENLPSEQPEPEIYYGYTPTHERPLADREIVPRLRDIQKQVGGSYAIDRAIEIIEEVAERRTSDDVESRN